ncbi:MAG: MvdD family ATP-grasp ribosomal peptide maturase [Dehalococcoidia bacterium]
MSAAGQPAAVLLVTTSYDLSAELVAASLARRGAYAVRFDTDHFPAEISACIDETGRWVLRTTTDELCSDAVDAVWYRKHAAPALPTTLDPAHAEFAEREARAFITGALLDLDGVRWVSDPTSVWRAEKKPAQLRVAAAVGFELPRTRITNDAAAVRVFAATVPVVAKAVSSGYITRDGSFETIFTSAVSTDDLDDLASLALAPVTFQEQVAKRSDVRVTVVGEHVFAAEIESQALQESRVDWRAADDPRRLIHREHDLPAAIASRCRILVQALGLRYGAIDLVRTEDDRYVFLEINPNGEWLWLQDALGWPIAERIAEELLG